MVARTGRGQAALQYRGQDLERQKVSSRCLAGRAAEAVDKWLDADSTTRANPLNW